MTTRNQTAPRFVIVAHRAPAAAFGDFRDVPASHDKIHRTRCRTEQAATREMDRQCQEYRESWGGGAVQAAWLETPGDPREDGRIYRAHLWTPIHQQVAEEMDREYNARPDGILASEN